jgi:hypothetical protein
MDVEADVPLDPACIFCEFHAKLLSLVVPRLNIGDGVGRGFFPKDIGTMRVGVAGTDAGS